jgi:acetyl esterase/lipase
MDDAAPAFVAREVPAKTLPVPETVSPQLRRSISNLAAQPRLPEGALPRTVEALRLFVAGADAQSLALRPILASLFPHTETPRELAGVRVHDIVPATRDPAKAARLLINFHGGGYIVNGGEASTAEAVLGAHYSGMTVLSVDYRMAPDHPFPAALDDAVAVWRAVIAERDPASVGVFGTSAGGGLTLALVQKLKALGLPLPGALAPSTPWADLTGASDSYRVNAEVDGIFSNFEGLGLFMAKTYAGETPLDHPLISPVNGDFSGFPPTLLTTGTRDILLSDTVRVHRKLRAAGAFSRLEVYEAMSHAEYMYAFDSPESASAFTDIAAFFDQHLKG